MLTLTRMESPKLCPRRNDCPWFELKGNGQPFSHDATVVGKFPKIAVVRCFVCDKQAEEGKDWFCSSCFGKGSHGMPFSTFLVCHECRRKHNMEITQQDEPDRADFDCSGIAPGETKEFKVGRLTMPPHGPDTRSLQKTSGHHATIRVYRCAVGEDRTEGGYLVSVKRNSDAGNCTFKRKANELYLSRLKEETEFEVTSPVAAFQQYHSALIFPSPHLAGCV